MDQIGLAAFVAVFLLAALALGIWVPFAMILVSIISLMIFTDISVGQVLASSIWGASTEWSLAALPMFIWMGEILFRSRLSQDLFDGLAPWAERLPGRLYHVNIVGSGLFAAVSGSSAATCATIGKMSLPSLRERGYAEPLAIGSLAGSATLGLLIPPSVILIVYGVAVEESIARLFLAGVLPGLLLMALFMAYVGAWAMLNRSRMPAIGPRLSLAERLRGTARLLPTVLLVFGVIFSIYGGFASPTDAAAVGAGMALLLTWWNGDLTRAIFSEALMSATRTACMIGFILVSAAFLTTVMGYTGIPRAVASWIGSLGLDKHVLLAALTVFFLLLGCFLDGISIVVLTTSVILPMVVAAGFDLVWFGIYLVLVVEISQITPPVGFNLFVVQNLTGRNILFIAKAALPFFLLILVALVLLVIFPGIATWLPGQVSYR